MTIQSQPPLATGTNVHTAKPVIEVHQLIKTYGDFKAVRGVSFEVYRGEVFGLLGPNGAGKTTTIEMMEGLRKPDGGYARIAGYDTQKELRKVKEVIGVQLQSTSLFDLLKVREIVEMYASFYQKPVPIDPLLDDMILREKATDRIRHLSGGQKQRLAIALALVNDPQVVFLDEPTTGLDPQARRTLWDIILKLKDRGKTVVLSTHYMDEAHVLCDRICLMDSGQVVALDTPRNLVASLQSESAIEFHLPAEDDLDAEQLTDRLALLKLLAHVKEVGWRAEDRFVSLYTDHMQTTLVDLIQKADEAGWGLTDLQTRTATLEDVFIHMTGRSLRE